MTIMGDYFIQQYEKTPVEEVEKRQEYLTTAKRSWMLEGLNAREMYHCATCHVSR